MSHLACIKHFKESNLSNALIFEDDTKINDENPGPKIQELLETLEFIPWNFIYLGYCWEELKNVKEISNNCIKLHNPLCRHAYIINKNIVDDYLNKLSQIKEPGDVSITQHIKNGTWSAYGPKELLFVQNRKELGSFLGNENQIRQFKENKYKMASH